jgi:ATP-dependent helicase/nuclease subunit B
LKTSNTVHPYQILVDHLKQGAIVITPNNRLSREILHYFADQNPKLCVEKPEVYAYPELLRHFFYETQLQLPRVSHPTLLNTIHLRKLWRKTLIESNIPVTDGLLEALMKSWSLCHEWRMNFTEQAFLELPQHQQFSQWVSHIEHLLQTHHAISEHHLSAYLQSNLSKLKLAQTWIWFCFDDYTPAQQALQEELSSLGYIIEHLDLSPKKAETYQLGVEEIYDEYQQLQAFIEKHNGSRIGIIVPTLEEEAQSLTRFIHQTLEQTHINISLSQPLSSYPLVAHALIWLSLDLQHVTPHQRHLLLTSPYIEQTREEKFRRAQWLQKSSLFIDETLSWTYFLKQLPPSPFKEKLEHLDTYPDSATITQWLSHFEHRLKQLGFPGKTELDSSSYQCLQRFIGLFDEFRSLQLLIPKMTQKEALETLQELANISMFQPERPQTSIHILGLLEASGCLFDYLWVMHMTDQNFPQQGQHSAFIPLSIQKKLNMPHANHTRDIKYATQIFERLIAGSRLQIFSYPKFNEDSPCLPSPFLNDLPVYPKFSPTPQRLHQRTTAEVNYHLPLRPQEDIKGGTTLLSNQAKCPFRAFAAHRLHLQKDNEISSGLNPKERGQLIHLILEKIWHELKSQQILMTMPKERLHSLVEQIIHDALRPFSEKHETSFPVLLQQLEHERIKQLILSCLDFEKSRPSFRIVALEKDAEITLANLTFRVKLDRLDELESGEKWVIDYKSHLPSEKPWQQDRPSEPQLLLYTILDESIHGMMFIELRHGKIQCAGFTDGKKLPGMQVLKENETWTTYQTQWRSQLTSLAEEFQIGHCHPAPIRESLCQTCEFKPLCRIE